MIMLKKQENKQIKNIKKDSKMEKEIHFRLGYVNRIIANIPFLKNVLRLLLLLKIVSVMDNILVLRRCLVRNM